MKAYLARAVDGELVLVMRTYNEEFMVKVVKKLQGIRDKELKAIFCELEEKIYECD